MTVLLVPESETRTPAWPLPEMTFRSAVSLVPSALVPMRAPAVPWLIHTPYRPLAMAADPAALVPM